MGCLAVAKQKTDGQRALFTAISNGKLKDVEALLAQGADLERRVNGMTPLHFVVDACGSLPGFRWLLERGVKLNELNDDDLTPLMSACAGTGVRAAEMALALITAGADVKVRREADGMSALEFAAEHSTPEVVSALVAKGALLDGKRGANQFPLLLAARAGNLANLKRLVELGCDLQRKTQLPWAKGLTCLGVAKLERKSAVVKYLESIGGAVNGRDAAPKTNR